MIHYISIDTNPTYKPKMYDSRNNTITPVEFEGVRTFLMEYINRLGIEPISIYESQLPTRTQLICWYKMPSKTRSATTESFIR